MTEQELSLGACCICGASEDVKNIIMIDRRCPLPGTGWGCVQCGLDNDGAVAVLCDACLMAYTNGDAELRFVCLGYASSGNRMSFDDLPEGEFNHDMSKHPEVVNDEQSI